MSPLNDYIVIEPHDLVIDLDTELIDLSVLGAGNYAHYEQAVLQLTNKIRQQHNVATVVHNRQLTQSAMAHTLDMVENNFFDHQGSDHSRVSDRALRAGYTDYSIVGENLAMGYPTPDAVVRGWMNSPGHRRNLLHPAYRELGVAYVLAQVRDNFGRMRPVSFWTQNFGARREHHSLLDVLPAQLQQALQCLKQPSLDDQIKILTDD